MVPGRFDFVEPMRRKMEIAADWIRDRLRFVVIVEAGEITPALVAAQFDQTSADHDPKTEPTKKPNDEKWGTTFRKRPAIKQRAEKDRQEPGLEQLRFPTITVPNLSDMDDRHVHRPKNGEHDCVRITGEDNK